ncbi:MAG: FAD-binding oxidoreductase [Pseudomonadota bacterium]
MKFHDTPSRSSYDVVIIGGAMMGSSAAWFLTRNPDFNGSILVVERDPTYEFASTTHTNSCIRQQFSSALNVGISQFGASFIKTYRETYDLADAPAIRLDAFGYLYLAGDEQKADWLRESQAVQASLGSATELLTPDQIKAEFPWMNVEDIVLGSIGRRDEGYFDGASLFDFWRRDASANGAEYVQDEVAAISRDGARASDVTLASGETVACGTLINASGPRGALTAAMLGVDLPVEPRRRFTYIFDSAQKLSGTVPLIIDPYGVHMRPEGNQFLTGCPPDPDPAMAPDDFPDEPGLFDDKLWPALYHRIPSFDQLKVTNSWVGHYAFNTLDHNAIVGPHDEIGNFILMNGFSGHGLQQSPAMGRGVSEIVAYGEYRTLDLSPLGYERIRKGEPFQELAVI